MKLLFLSLISLLLLPSSLSALSVKPITPSYVLSVIADESEEEEDIFYEEDEGEGMNEFLRLSIFLGTIVLIGLLAYMLT